MKDKVAVIAQHRHVQRIETEARNRIRKALVRDIFHAREILRIVLAHGGNAVDIANSMEDVRELQEMLHQVVLDDDISNNFWKSHFSLPQYRMTITDRRAAGKSLSSAAASSLHEDGRRGIAQHLRHKTSKTSLSRGDGSHLFDTVFNRQKSPNRGSANFRVPENGNVGVRHGKLYSPPRSRQSSPTTELEQSQSNSFRPASPISLAAEENDVAVLNQRALQMMHKSRFREAFKFLARAMEVQDSSDNVAPDLRATTFCNMSTLCRRCGDLKRAKEYLDECCRIEREHSDNGSCSPVTTLNLSALLLQLGDVHQATSLVRSLIDTLSSADSATKESASTAQLLAICREHMKTCKKTSEALDRSNDSTSQTAGDDDEPDELTINHELYADMWSWIADWKRRTAFQSRRLDRHETAPPDEVEEEQHHYLGAMGGLIQAHSGEAAVEDELNHEDAAVVGNVTQAQEEEEDQEDLLATQDPELEPITEIVREKETSSVHETQDQPEEVQDAPSE